MADTPLATPAATAPTLLFDVDDLARELRVSPATIWRMRSAGRLPAPIVLSRGITRWRRSDIEAWILSGCPAQEVAP